MAERKKKYIFDKDVAVTAYAKKKIKKYLKSKQVCRTVENIINHEVGQEVDDVCDSHSSDNSDEQCNDEQMVDMETSISANEEFTSETECARTIDNYDYSSDEDFMQILEESEEPCSGILKMINEDDFLAPVETNVDKSPAELLLISLKYALANAIPLSGIINLLKLVNRICGKTILPDSSYLFDKFCATENIVTLHAVCLTCSKYLGTFEEFNKSVHCEMCNNLVDVSNPSNACYFAIINPSNTVRDYLQMHEDYYDYVVSKRIHEKDHIKDIYDGHLYRQFVNNLSDENRHAYATAIFNSDGAPIFESSTSSIWPIYLMLNELPLSHRFNSTIVSALWFGSGKPDMTVFLDAFVQTMNQLSTVGITCNIKNQNRQIKLFALIACVDTVARAPMNGTSMFNAKYGCDWCLHPGQYYGGSMRYPVILPPAPERDRFNMLDHAREAVRRGAPVFGVKNVSPLLYLQGFEIIEGFTPDYMHCYLAGVAKQFTECVLKYVSLKDIQCMDKLLLSIKAPHQIGRLSRPISQRNYWKASEWENWLLFYSIPVLTCTLTNQVIIKHWSLLVESLHIRANQMLHRFVAQVEDIYSLTHLTYNVHQLLHLCKSIYNWGPLWAHSTFCFEAANHKLLRAIHSAKGVISQIIRNLNIERTVHILENTIYPNCSQLVLNFCQNIVSTKTRKVLKLTTVTYFGRKRSVNQSITETFKVPKTALIFSKIVKNNCLFGTSQKVNQRSCNFYAELSNGDFVQLLYFLVDIKSKQELTLCKIVHTTVNNYCNSLKNVTNIADNEVCINTQDILKPCVFIAFRNQTYIIPLPNVISH